MRLSIDVPKSGTADVVARFRAMSRSLDGAGSGEVLVSRRKKLAGEKGRALHGKAIANLLRDLGHDPFDYPDGVLKSLDTRVVHGVIALLGAAYHTKRALPRRLKEVVLEASQSLADWTCDALKGGRLGSNSKKLARLKLRLIGRGLATDRYGSPPPWGVRTGRFVEGIRARWRRGAGRQVHAQ